MPRLNDPRKYGPLLLLMLFAAFPPTLKAESPTSSNAPEIAQGIDSGIPSEADWPPEVWAAIDKIVGEIIDDAIDEAVRETVSVYKPKLEAETRRADYYEDEASAAARAVKAWKIGATIGGVLSLGGIVAAFLYGFSLGAK
jgi:hypothetical protein